MKSIFSLAALAATAILPVASWALGEPDASYTAQGLGESAFCDGPAQVQGDRDALQAYARGPNDGVVRRAPDGTIDTSWGSGGLSEWTRTSTTLSSKTILRLPDGGYLVVGRYANKLRANGSLDAAYGIEGTSVDIVGPDRLSGLVGASVMPDGGLVALVNSYDAAANGQTLTFVRLTRTGNLDTSFWTNGRLAIAAPFPSTIPYAWGVQADAQVQLSVYSGSTGAFQTERYPNPFTVADNVEGRMVPRGVAAAWMSNAARVDPSGRLVIVVPSHPAEPQALSVLRFTSAGRPDPAFGNSGRQGLSVGGPFGFGHNYGAHALWLGAGDTLTVVAAHLQVLGRASIIDQTLRAFQLSATGAPAVADGVVIGAVDDYVAQQDDGRILVSSRVGCGAKRVQGASPRSDAQLVEYQVDRGRILGTAYFLTAEGTETAILDAAPTADGWRRTGRQFGAWLPAAGLAGSVPVCRFYGDLAAGPNSHFYTLQGPECEGLKAAEAATPVGQRAWRLEGLMFSAAQGPGACPPNLEPVHRFYDDGVRRGIDPHHRYTTDPAVVAEMQNRGWLYEGIVFCTPPRAS